MAYCVDEAVTMFGQIVDGEVDSVKRKKKESDEAYSRRRQRALLSALDMKDQIEYAQPVATM